MAEIQLGVVESRFADIIWKNEPVSSSTLVKLAGEELQWKRTTAHTVLRRLCDKGLFQNDNGTVTSLISREQSTPCRVNSSLMPPFRALFQRSWRPSPKTVP